MRTRDNDQRLIDQGETVAARVNPELAAKIREQVNAKQANLLLAIRSDV
jgi:hypothetical protein